MNKPESEMENYSDEFLSVGTKLGDSLDGPSELDGWQPWNTAPKDGTAILVFFEDGRIRIARWEAHADSSYPFAWKNEYSETLIREWKRDEYFTHWHALPKFPCVPPEGVAFAKHEYEPYED